MTTMSDLRGAASFLKAHFPRGGRVLCAVSGGLDSMCLLHFMLRQDGFAVAAAHFNHRLRGERSDADQLFVERWCADHRVPCYVGEGDTLARAEAAGESVEEAARVLRYAFLHRTAEDYGYDAILTAHHAGDNAETVLLNLLRGTGTAGLGGIPAVNGAVYRPFLRIEKAALASYAEENRIPHVEDESNESDDAARNLLRHRVMPVLQELNPRAAVNISRAAALAAADNGVLETLAGETAEKGTAEALLAAPEAVASRAALMMLGNLAGGRKDLTARHAEMLLALVRSGRGEAHFPHGVHARMDRAGGLVLWKQDRTAEQSSIEINQTVRWGDWEVTLTETDRGGRALCLDENAPLRITAWRGEDRMTLPGSRGPRTVKRLCAERGISPAERDGLPLLRVGEQPAAMARVGINLDFAPRKENKAVYIEFKDIKKGESV